MNEYQLENCLKLAEGHENVFVYMSKEDEPDTKDFIETLLSIGKTVIVPKLEDEIKPALHSYEMKTGKFGVREPVDTEHFDKNKIDIFFVPGTKFDLKGNRTGRGKGYFDRFLKNVDKQKVGICFENQIVEEIKPNPWDIPVDIIVSEKKIIK